MNQHTPGPWTVGGPTGFLNQIAIEPSIGCTYGKTDAIANAHLIAAAPELLAALLPCVEFDGGQCLGDYPEKLERARAAIAKATGGAS